MTPTPALDMMEFDAAASTSFATARDKHHDCMHGDWIGTPSACQPVGRWRSCTSPACPCCPPLRGPTPPRHWLPGSSCPRRRQSPPRCPAPRHLPPPQPPSSAPTRHASSTLGIPAHSVRKASADRRTRTMVRSNLAAHLRINAEADAALQRLAAHFQHHPPATVQ